VKVLFAKLTAASVGSESLLLNCMMVVQCGSQNILPLNLVSIVWQNITLYGCSFS